MDSAEHWQSVYDRKAADEVSWFQDAPVLSLALIQKAVPNHSARILDVGSGASLLTDALLNAGYTNISVLDLAAAALDKTRTRLGISANAVTWLVGDVLKIEVARESADLWHDRAVFHFLTQPEDRVQYVQQVRRALGLGGYAVIATFAEDGPLRCSGLETARYSAEQLQAEFAHGFVLEESHRESHVTPGGGVQAFTYCLFRRSPTVNNPAISDK
jgi:SAM-dependent methyltransferase